MFEDLAELELDAKGKALAKCAVDEQIKPIRRWRDHPGLWEFLHGLYALVMWRSNGRSPLMRRLSQPSAT
jgi:hypothetical protein